MRVPSCWQHRLLHVSRPWGPSFSFVRLVDAQAGDWGATAMELRGCSGVHGGEACVRSSLGHRAHSPYLPRWS